MIFRSGNAGPSASWRTDISKFATDTLPTQSGAAACAAIPAARRRTRSLTIKSTDKTLAALKKPATSSLPSLAEVCKRGVGFHHGRVLKNAKKSTPQHLCRLHNESTGYTGDGTFKRGDSTCNRATRIARCCGLLFLGNRPPCRPEHTDSGRSMLFGLRLDY